LKSNLPKEGLQVLRLIMVLSSMAPLFLLWAVRGSGPVPDKYFVPGCLLLAVAPTIVLGWRIRTAKKINDCQTKTIHRADDHRDHILVYLFAMMLPFYTVNLLDWREFAATAVALLFILFLFWHLNMHYMNLLFAIKGYRVFTVTPDSNDRLGSRTPFVILTKRIALPEGDQIETYRLSDTVFIEK
jgi:hypothetical protein